MAGKSETANNTEPRAEYAPYPLSAALDFLEDRTYRCPCCDAEFSERRVRVNDLTYLGCDSDLRPQYEPVDPVLYDVVVCRNCGYGSLSKTFDNLTFRQAQVIISRLPSSYKKTCFPLVYTEDVAINRYKTALMCAMLTRENSGVIAYLYMRLAWIYRSKGDEAMELRMIAASLEGFSEAVGKDFFPIVDLDEETVYYIMGDFMRRLSKEDDAGRFFTKAYEVKNKPLRQ